MGTGGDGKEKTVSLLRQAVAQVESVVQGKSRAIRIVFASLLARGHVLIEDQPGVGKTTLALAVARTLGLSFQRIQFTADLLPADILGASWPDPQTGELRFQRGPIFTHVLLADEINRATPKTQSALLEAMAEGQVTLEGRTFSLPRPFFVIATQNPVDAAGTFPLPHSQMDRFLVRLHLGYPDPEAELIILRMGNPMARARELPPILDARTVTRLQDQSARIHVDDTLLRYATQVARALRDEPRLITGLSTRGVIQWIALARAWALMDGRTYVIPEDLRDLAPFVMLHRLMAAEGESLPYVLEEILERIPLPV